MSNEISIKEKRLLNVHELCSYLSLGRNKAVEFGKLHNAEKRIGGRLLFDRLVIDAAIDRIGSDS